MANRAARWWFTPLVGMVLVALIGIFVGFVHDDVSIGLSSDELVTALSGGIACAVLLGINCYSTRASAQINSRSDSTSTVAPLGVPSLLLFGERLTFELSEAIANESVGTFYGRAAEILVQVFEADAVALYRKDENGTISLVTSVPESSGFAPIVENWPGNDSESLDLSALGLADKGLWIFFADHWLAVTKLPCDRGCNDSLAYVQAQLDAAFRFAEQAAYSIETTSETISRYVRQFFSLTENPMCLVGPDGFSIKLSNQAFQNKYVIESPTETGDSLFLDNTSCRDHLEHFYHLALGKDGRVTEQLELLCCDGVRRVTQIEALRIVGARGQINGHVIMFFLDLSERQSLETRLARAARMEGIGQLAGGVAHDFNNILTVINGSAEFALENLDAGMDVTSDLEEILKAGRRAATLTRQLLAFSRKQAMVIESLNFNDLVREISNMLQRLIQEDIELRMQLAPDIGLVHADTGQMQQVLMNLVVNARDAIGSSGIITIETANVVIDQAFCEAHAGAEAGPAVRLSVRDTGCGMSKEVLEHMFEPFFTTKGPEKGTGLGLASVFGIVKQLGGNIYASSVEGVGTCFDVYLPRVVQNIGPSVEGIQAELLDDLRGARIIVVEDQQQVRDLTVHMLRSLGYIAIGAESGNAALAFLTAPSRAGTIDSPHCPVDLLITDVVMPGMGGVELVEQVQQMFPSVAVMFMSGHSKELVTREMGESSDVVLLRKPFTLNDLRKCVQVCLRARKN